MPNIDWDRERREEKARSHGREPARLALATGLSETKRQWRSAGARGIWVRPLLGKSGELVVLLPKRPYVPRAAWRVVALSEAGQQAHHVYGGGEHAVVFTIRGDWNVKVFFEDDGGEALEEEFEDYYPAPFS